MKCPLQLGDAFPYASEIQCMDFRLKSNFHIISDSACTSDVKTD